MHSDHDLCMIVREEQERWRAKSRSTEREQSQRFATFAEFGELSTSASTKGTNWLCAACSRELVSQNDLKENKDSKREIERERKIVVAVAAVALAVVVVVVVVVVAAVVS